MGTMPRADLIGPFGDRASEMADLDGHCGVREITDDLSDPGLSEFGIGVVVDLTNDLFRVPREPHLLSGVARSEQSKDPFVLGVR